VNRERGNFILVTTCVTQTITILKRSDGVIGKAIKSKRRKLGLTQKQLAKMVSLDQRDISVHENTRRDLSLVNKTHNRILEEFFEGAS
jgi:ribosome-binding protein aMBF1 (putative translation factor)